MNTAGYRLLSDSLPVGDEGQPLVDVGFYITLFFENGHLPERRLAAYQLFKEYWFRVGDHLRWTTDVKTYNWEPITTKYSPEAWLAQQPKEPWTWNICVHGGDTFDAASAFRFDALGTPSPELHLSYVHATFPASWFAEHPEASAVDIMLRWATTLRPVNGTAGLSIITPMDTTRQAAVAAQARALAERFPGLEVDNVISHSLYAQQGIRSVNWLTCLDDALLARLGGVGQVRANLSADLHLLEYPGGAILRAGDYPQAGDRNRQISVEPYRRAAALLKPVRADYPGVFLGFDRESTDDWLHRFD